MPRLSKLITGKPKSVAVEFENGEVVNVEVNIAAFTLGSQRRFNEASKAGDLESVAAEFFKFVTKWDVEDEKGKTLPLNSEALSHLPIGVFMHLVSVITEHLDPNDIAPTK